MSIGALQVQRLPQIYTNTDTDYCLVDVCTWILTTRIGLQADGNGLWDTEHMKKNFDVLFEEDVIKEYGAVANHPILGKKWTVRCVYILQYVYTSKVCGMWHGDGVLVYFRFVGWLIILIMFCELEYRQHYAHIHAHATTPNDAPRHTPLAHAPRVRALLSALPPLPAAHLCHALLPLPSSACCSCCAAR